MKEWGTRHSRDRKRKKGVVGIEEGFLCTEEQTKVLKIFPFRSVSWRLGDLAALAWFPRVQHYSYCTNLRPMVLSRFTALYPPYFGSILCLRWARSLYICLLSSSISRPPRSPRYSEKGRIFYYFVTSSASSPLNFWQIIRISLVVQPLFLQLTRHLLFRCFCSHVIFAIYYGITLFCLSYVLWLAL